MLRNNELLAIAAAAGAIAPPASVLVLVSDLCAIDSEATRLADKRMEDLPRSAVSGKTSAGDLQR